jgi:hypothetical protein
MICPVLAIARCAIALTDQLKKATLKALRAATATEQYAALC